MHAASKRHTHQKALSLNPSFVCLFAFDSKGEHKDKMTIKESIIVIFQYYILPFPVYCFSSPKLVAH